MQALNIDPKSGHQKLEGIPQIRLLEFDLVEFDHTEKVEAIHNERII